MTTALEGGQWSAARPGLLYPRERPGTNCAGGWVGPRAGLDGEKSRPTGIRSLDRPACSQSLYRLSYPAHWEIRRLYILRLFVDILDGVPCLFAASDVF